MGKSNQLLVLQVISSPTGGGAEVLVRELSSKLCNYGIASETIYFSRKDVQLHTNELALNIGCRNPFVIFKLRNIFHAKLSSFDRLIIHSHLTWPFFYVVLASLGLNIILLFTEHSTSNNRRRIPFMKYVERLFYKRYNKIICISQGVKNLLDEWIGEKLSLRSQVIFNGACIYNLQKRDFFTKKIHFVSIGSLTVKKNFRISLRALSLLKGYDWVYTIVGEGPERNTLVNLAVNLGIHDKVHFVGWSNEVEKYLYQADIQLIPSLWEGFGLVAVEGMSTGLPVVASNVDGLREVLNKDNLAVFLVDEIANPQCWVSKIEECVSSLKKSRNVLTEASRKQAEKFSLDKMIYNYANFYKEIDKEIDKKWHIS